MPKCTDKDCQLKTDFTCEDELESKEEETNIIKRDIEHQQKSAKKKSKKRRRVSVKFNIKAEYDKQIEINAAAFQKNLQKHLKQRNFVEPNVTLSLGKPQYICPVGYGARKNKCGSLTVALFIITLFYTF